MQTQNQYSIRNAEARNYNLAFLGAVGTTCRPGEQVQIDLFQQSSGGPLSYLTSAETKTETIK